MLKVKIKKISSVLFPEGTFLGEVIRGAYGGYKWWKFMNSSSSNSDLNSLNDVAQSDVKKSSCDEFYLKALRDISSDLTREVVYIFQYSFFDPKGEVCYSGGAERYVVDLADVLRGMGLKTVLFQLGTHEADRPWIRKERNLTIIGVNQDYKGYQEQISLLPDSRLSIYSGFVDWGKQVHKNSVIISHGVTWDVPYANASTSCLKEILDRFDKVISVDTNTISWFRSTFSKDLAECKNKFIFIPNYIEAKFFQTIEKSSRVRILFPRRLCKERGFWLFMPVAKKLLMKYEQVEVHFIGFIHDEDIRQELNSVMTSYPSRCFHKLVKSEDMYKVYRTGDISLIPTLYAEGTSLSCLEAMAAGNCVIATNIGGLTNLIIDGYNGILINPTQQDLYEALEKVVLQPEYRARLGKNAQDVASSFSQEKWKDAWRNVIRSMDIAEL